jgi:hypothetical protein
MRGGGNILFDIKLGVGAAGAAFILSLLVGLVSGAGFIIVLVRALVFAALFFGLSFGAQKLLALFVPELLGLPGAQEVEPDSEIGSRIDVVVGDETEGPTIEGSVAAEAPRKRAVIEDDEGEEAEEIAGFLPEDGIGGAAAAATDEVGLDQGSEGRYTEKRDTDGVANTFGGKGVEPALPSGLIDDVDVLPDLDSMSDSFVSPLVEEATERSSAESFSPRLSSASRSSETGGDFDPREMAAAIQTILKRDQKG